MRTDFFSLSGYERQSTCRTKVDTPQSPDRNFDAAGAAPATHAANLNRGVLSIGRFAIRCLGSASHLARLPLTDTQLFDVVDKGRYL
jgi:hypothetical protein